MDTKTRSLTLPTAGSEPSSTTSVESSGPIVVVGANGSGKTRLGSWFDLESEQAEKVRRISAQKSLNMPESAPSIAVDLAETDLLFGAQQASRNIQYKLLGRWAGRPNTLLLSDFDKLLTYLFSDATQSNAEYVEEARKAPPTERPEPPETKLYRTKRIWEEVLPHRQLIIGGGQGRNGG